MAQQFILKGHHIEVKYTTGITPGLTALTYKDGSVSHDFKTDEISTEKTQLGTLISIALVKSIDIGGTNFGFFLPDVLAFFYPMFQKIRPSTLRPLPYEKNSVALTPSPTGQPSGIAFPCMER